MSAPPRLTAPERREAILSAALALFSERGFRGVTTRELAASVGVTEPVLYQHFPSKRDLYRALIEKKISDTKNLHDEFRAICEEPKSPEEFFHSLASMIMAWHQADPAFMRLLLLSSLEGDELREMFRERMIDNYFAVLGGAFAKLFAREGFRNVDPIHACYTFCAMIGHHCLDRLLLHHPLTETSDEAILVSMVDIFLNGLKKEKS